MRLVRFVHSGHLLRTTWRLLHLVVISQRIQSTRFVQVLTTLRLQTRTKKVRTCLHFRHVRHWVLHPCHSRLSHSSQCYDCSNHKDMRALPETNKRPGKNFPAFFMGEQVCALLWLASRSGLLRWPYISLLFIITRLQGNTCNPESFYENAFSIF